MHTPRQVPGIAQQRQQFSRDNLPPIPHPMMIGSQPPQDPAAAITDRVQELAIDIYTRAAAEYIATSRPTPPALRELAEYAQTAALAYFEQLGVNFH